MRIDEVDKKLFCEQFFHIFELQNGDPIPGKKYGGNSFNTYATTRSIIIFCQYIGLCIFIYLWIIIVYIYIFVFYTESLYKTVISVTFELKMIENSLNTHSTDFAQEKIA